MRVSKNEFHEVRNSLRYKGFSDRDVGEVEKLFRGDMHESGDHSGIDTKEIEGGLKWMRENMSKHKLSEKKINTLEESLKKKL